MSDGKKEAEEYADGIDRTISLEEVGEGTGPSQLWRNSVEDFKAGYAAGRKALVEEAEKVAWDAGIVGFPQNRAVSIAELKKLAGVE